MGYFRANDRYLQGTPDAGVDPPWDVQAQEAGQPGSVRLTWRRPYTALDGFGEPQPEVRLREPDRGA